MRALGLVIAIGFALVSSTAAVRAQDTEPNARALFEQGVTLAAAQSWQEAAERFRASLALEPRASTLFNLAVTLYRLEQYAELLAVAERYLELGDPARSTADVAEITRLRAKALERVARVRIAVSPSSAEVLLDGALLEPSVLETDLVLEPGTHEVLARAPDFIEQRASLEAHAGERSRLQLSLTKSAVEPAASTTHAPLIEPTPASHAYTQPSDDGSVWSSPWLWVGVGSGVAIIATVAVVLLAGGEAQPADYGRMMF